MRAHPAAVALFSICIALVGCGTSTIATPPAGQNTGGGFNPQGSDVSKSDTGQAADAGTSDSRATAGADTAANVDSGGTSTPDTSTAPDTAVTDTATAKDSGSDPIDAGPMDAGAADAGPEDAGTPDTGPSCVKTKPPTEVCDGVDNDCDGKTDDVSCDDKIACTTESCLGKAGCVFKVLDTACDDGDPCTTDDKCAKTGCVGQVKVCDDKNDCTNDSCKKGFGCLFSDVSGPCDDGKTCTTNDTCSGGKCSGKAKVCNDGNACTTDACDDKAGCTAKPLKDGAVCIGGTCQGGTCKKPVCTGGQLGGSYTVGPGGKWATINAAISALKTSGVCAKTTVTVLAGTYKESQGFRFPVITGASNTKRVHFRAAPGATVKLVGNTGTSSYNGTIKIDSNAVGLTIEGFEIDGKEPNNKVRSSYSGPVVFGSSGGHKHITLSNLYIHDFGPTAWKTYTYLGAIYMQQSNTVTDIEIRGCRIHNINPPNSFHTQGGISTRNGRHNGFRIIGNRISGVRKMDLINLRNGNGWTDVVIVNNQLIVDDGKFAALEWYGSNTLKTNAVFAHNSVVLASGGKVIRGSLSGNKQDVRNNLVYALGSATFIQSTPVNTYGGNCLHGISAPNGAVAKPPDVKAKPVFKSGAPNWDLHLQPTSPCLNGAPLMNAVRFDIDGDKRNNPADIGMDEIK